MENYSKNNKSNPNMYGLERHKSMNNDQAKMFLDLIGSREFNYENWKSGGPLVWVMPDKIRDLHFNKQNYTEDMQPSVVLLTGPVSVTLLNNNNFLIKNEEKLVEYYAVDSVNSYPTLVKISAKNCEYKAEEGSLYSADEFIDCLNKHKNIGDIIIKK